MNHHQHGTNTLLFRNGWTLHTQTQPVDLHVTSPGSHGLEKPLISSEQSVALLLTVSP